MAKKMDQTLWNCSRLFRKRCWLCHHGFIRRSRWLNSNCRIHSILTQLLFCFLFNIGCGGKENTMNVSWTQMLPYGWTVGLSCGFAVPLFRDCISMETEELSWWAANENFKSGLRGIVINACGFWDATIDYENQRKGNAEIPSLTSGHSFQNAKRK